MALVRVFEPANAVELAKARLILEASGVNYFVDGEHYFAAGGGSPAYRFPIFMLVSMRYGECSPSRWYWNIDFVMWEGI